MPSKPPVFRPAWAQSRGQQRREQDHRRGSARERGYTAQWDRAAAIFKREHPLCLGCSAIDETKPTFLIDHAIPHRGDQRLFWDQGNWQSACEWHGNAVKQRLEQLFDQGKLNAAALRLDSVEAVAMSREMMGVGG